MEIEKIEVSGYRDEKVESQFFNHHTDGLAILLPGLGYTNDMPLQYYIAKHFEAKEMDILKVNYRYNDKDGFIDASLEEKSAWIRADVVSSVESILKRKKYKRIVLVCKSLGTIAGLELLASMEELRQAEVIWLTPLCQNPVVMQGLLEIDNPSLLIIGTDDPCYVNENIQKLKKKGNYKIMIIHDADHSLEIKGDLSRSISIMGRMIRKIDHFSSERSHE